jgi:hypothetical protein
MGHASEVSGGEQQLITLEVNAEELPLGTYEHTAVITSNARNSVVKRLPVRVRVTDGVTGIVPQEATSLRVYPVPANRTIHVQLHESIQGSVQLVIRNTVRTVGVVTVSNTATTHELSDFGGSVEARCVFPAGSRGGWSAPRAVVY